MIEFPFNLQLPWRPLLWQLLLLAAGLVLLLVPSLMVGFGRWFSRRGLAGWLAASGLAAVGAVVLAAAVIALLWLWSWAFPKPGFIIDFESPWYLALLLLSPGLGWVCWRSLAGLGAFRSQLVVALRSAVLLLLVLAAAEIKTILVSDKVTVIYLLDQSRSIPVAQREAMIRYVNAAIAEHRKAEDKVGVIVFGRDAAIEIPPFDDDIQMAPTIESLLDPDFTNLAGALKLAQASFPEDAAKRVVLVSDGNENLGDALEQARSLTDAGVGIDVRPVHYQSRAEVSVEKLTLPADVAKGQPFDLRVVLNNTTQPTADDPGEVSGDLIIRLKTDDQPQVISQERVTLPPGKSVFTVRQELELPHFYTYEAEFVPERPEDDGLRENNEASTFTHIRGSRQVLLIEDQQNRGEFDYLVERLRASDFEVTVQPTDQLFTGLPALQPFDTVVLANVPREAFSDEQVQTLVRNTEFMGAGLVMLGGPNSFGAGGWANTELEKAMPVDFQIKSAKVVPKGALVLIMHASELPQGNYWQKIIAQEALKTLGNQDYCGVLHWDGNGKWLWNHPKGLIQVGGNRDKMLARLDQMTPGDMPDFDPIVKMGWRGFTQVPDAAVKHMILISDGDPSPTSRSVLNNLVAAKITCSTVAVGTHGPAGSNELKRIAKATGGKYYQVNNNRALPRIFQREARRVARPLVYENANGVVPQSPSFHEILEGIDGPFPPITGFVMTTKKHNPLVEVALVSPLPPAADNNTLLATWTYGLGRSVVFTSDAGKRWTTSWTSWEDYDKLFSQMIFWSMRQQQEQGKFTVATDVQDGKVRVVVTALDKDDQFLNFLDMSATAVGPNPKTEPIGVKMEQTAPGRYVGEFPGQDAGSYFISLVPGAGQAPILTGVDVPYSAEFRDRVTDDALLSTLANLAPKGGRPGRLIDDSTGANAPDGLLAVNPFRRDLPKATSNQPYWYLLAVVAGCLFLADVFFRRVTFDVLAWAVWALAPVRDFILRREHKPAPVEYMQRLRHRKAEVGERIEQQRAAARFEPAPDAPVSTGTLEEQLGAAPPSVAPNAAAAGGLTPEKEEESYTSRLLKAKKQVWQERKEKS